MFEIQLENAFDFNSAEYRRLFDGSRATAFQHPLWLDQIYRTLAPAAGAEPLIAVARRRIDGSPVMVLPLLRQRRLGLKMIEFADLGVTDYAAAICDDEAFELLARDPRTPARLRTLLKPFDLLRIKKRPEGGQRLDLLFGAARRTSMGVSTHSALLFEPYSDWRAAKLPRSYAKELDKKRRRMHRLGDFRFERLREPEAVDALLRDLQTYRGERFPDDLLRQPSYFDFYRNIALSGAASGFARAYRLSLNGASLGGVWGLSHRGRFLVLITGLNYAAHPRESIGSLAFEDLARDCIAERDSVLDFTIGDESYKQLFGAEPAPMWMVSSAGSGLGALADRLVTRPPSRRRAPTELGEEPPRAAAE